ncbi:hypothetical protein [Proteus columbae]|uniref:hypothetical protein n=1 Tax=Proteus columbae TaxID=1987580 RepID=UPI002889CF5F|nr:hypothetical protein [Proteus columbae]
MMESILLSGKVDVDYFGSYEGFDKWIKDNSSKLFISSLVGSNPPRAEASKTDPIVIELDNIEYNVMWGTPWHNYVTHDSPYEKIIRHSVPAESVWANLMRLKQKVIITFAGYGSRSSYISLNRNGLISKSYGQYIGMRVESLIYYDDAIGRTMMINPYSGYQAVPWSGGL